MKIPENLKQRRVDVSNLRFYSLLFREKHWETDVLHWTVFAQTLDEIASRVEHDAERMADLQAGIDKHIEQCPSCLADVRDCTCKM